MNETFLPNYVMWHKIYTMEDHPDVLKMVVLSAERSDYSILCGNGWEVQETHNYEEPFDLRIHVFYIRDCWLQDGAKLMMKFRNRKNSKFYPAMGEYSYTEFICDLSDIREERELIGEICDTRIIDTHRKSEEISDGITWTEVSGNDKDGKPMKWFYFTVKYGKGTFLAGTANDGRLPDTAIQSVEEQALAVRAKGINVVGATNADFFDMFGDNHPSGPVIKNGTAVCNGDSHRAFFGVDKTGAPVIGDFRHEPWLKGNMKEVVAGLQRIIKNGEIGDVWPGERFCSDRHPRTAVGITEDKDVIVMVIDGRMPEYSNGMTLYDVAVKMKELGAVNAINLDGGGSSTFQVWNGERFEMKNKPVDAAKPGIMLIREIFCTLLIVAND